MNDKKVVFVDVDQTLFDNKNNILYPSTIKVMEELSKRKDIDIFIATGRGINFLNHLKSIMPYVKGFITNNGQTVFYQNEIIYDNQIGKEIIEKIENYANDNNISLAYATEYEALVNFHNEYSIKALNNFHINNAQSLNKSKCPENLKVKQFWFFGNHEEINQAREKITELDFILWPGEIGCDVVTKGVSKKQGIEIVIDKLGYQLENTYAIGDGDNDIEMFRTVKYSIAMGNGTEKAKKNACYITDRIDNDGFAKAIKKYILNKKQ